MYREFIVVEWTLTPFINMFELKSQHWWVITCPAKLKWNYLYILKLQWCNWWSLGIEKWFYSTFHDSCNYLSMLRLKLIRVSNMGPNSQPLYFLYTHHTFARWVIYDHNGILTRRSLDLLWCCSSKSTEKYIHYAHIRFGYKLIG